MRFTAWLTVEALLVLLALLAILSLALVFSAVRRGGRREDPIEDEAVAASRFTLPVSIIVPQDPISGGLSDTVASLLALNYPEFEVIVVADQPNDAHFQSLALEWQLTPKEYFYRRSVATSAVHRIFESRCDERLIFVTKERAGRTDALNCGLSLARFRYVACVAPNVVVDDNALLRLMTPALRNPGSVLAATGHIERRFASDCNIPSGGLWHGAASDWQRIRSVRSWLASRLTIGRPNGGVAPPDGVIVWRREALLQMGGFSTDATDPEFEMILRLQASKQVSGQVVRTGEIVGRIDPISLSRVGQLQLQRQRALIEAAAALRHAERPTNGRAAAVVFLATELLTPISQCGAILAVILGAAAGWFSWMNLLLLLVMLSMGRAAITAAALLLRGAVPGAPTFVELLRLLLLAPAEYVVYAPALVLSRLSLRPRRS